VAAARLAYHAREAFERGRVEAVGRDGARDRLPVGGRARPDGLGPLSLRVAVRLVEVSAARVRLLLERRPGGAEALRGVLDLPRVEVPDRRRLAPRGLAPPPGLARVNRRDVGGRDDRRAHHVAL